MELPITARDPPIPGRVDVGRRVGHVSVPIGGVVECHAWEVLGLMNPPRGCWLHPTVTGCLLAPERCHRTRRPRRYLLYCMLDADAIPLGRALYPPTDASFE
jgi:hypothetical protein